jgi:hypothetical protein
VILPVLVLGGAAFIIAPPPHSLSSVLVLENLSPPLSLPLPQIYRGREEEDI